VVEDVLIEQDSYGNPRTNGKGKWISWETLARGEAGQVTASGEGAGATSFLAKRAALREMSPSNFLDVRGNSGNCSLSSYGCKREKPIEQVRERGVAAKCV